jgi:hypothetical protein
MSRKALCLAVIVAVSICNLAGQGVPNSGGLSLRGQVRFEGIGPGPKLIPEARVVLIPSTLDSATVAKFGAGLLPATTVPGGVITPDGQFAVEGLTPGRYFLNAMWIPHMWHVVSIMSNGKDVGETGIEVVAGATPPDLLLTYSNRQTGVEGVLRLPPGQLPSAFTVVAFNSIPDIFGQRRIARPGPGGNFTLELPPGRYFVAAVRGYSARMGKKEFFEEVGPNAIEVTLSDGERLIRDLSVAP